MKNKSIKISDTGVNLTANCKKCGEPIDHSNEFGVFCKNNCYLEESKEAYKKIKKIFGGLLNIK